MDIISEYIQNIAYMKLSNDDFGDKKKVKNSNRLAIRNRKIVSLIEKTHYELKDDFVKLLDSDNEEVKRWVAHHVLEIMTVDAPIRKKALSIIEYESKHHEDAPTRMGNTIYLKKYYGEHPEDKDL